MNILIAIDESPVSTRAAREAVRLFGSGDNRFLVVNVASVPVPWAGAAGFGAVGPLPEPMWTDPDALADRAEADERELKVLAEDAGIPAADVEVRAGNVVSEICAAADSHDADVIVVGSHDKPALRRLFDPSVAAGVTRSTHRPVLVVSGQPPSGH